MNQITLQRPDSKELTGYYCQAQNSNDAPVIVFIQEWWVINDQIKGVAQRLCEAGYRTLVPDLYRGKVTVEAQEAEHLMGNLDFADAVTQDIRGAVQYLKQTDTNQNNPGVGVIGYCMGGALSILTALHVKEVDALVSWYGVPPEEAGDTRMIQIPLQGHFATDDEFFPPKQVESLEAGLKEGNVNYEFYWYSSKHAF